MGFSMGLSQGCHKRTIPQSSQKEKRWYVETIPSQSGGNHDIFLPLPSWDKK
jgi:hypothetical protein